MKCWNEESDPIFDTQEHVFECQILAKNENSTSLIDKKIIHDDIYGNVVSQKAAVTKFQVLMKIREQLNSEESSPVSSTGPKASVAVQT